LQFAFGERGFLNPILAAAAMALAQSRSSATHCVCGDSNPLRSNI
jgi:hypothetical protein